MAVLMLALGLGASTAVFSIVNTILLKPASFSEPDRLVMLMLTANGTPFFAGSSPAQFVHFESTAADTLEDIAAFAATSFNYTGADVSARVTGAEVSEAYFRTLRAPFVEGRGFTSDETIPGGPRVAVVSHTFWTRYLDADANTVGRTISLNGDAYTVVGIAGAELDMRELGAPEVWTPLEVNPAAAAHAYLYSVVARLRPGVTLKQAQDQLAASTAAFRERFPGVLGPRAGFGAMKLEDAFVRSDTRTTLAVLAGAVAFVLVIVCANVANLLLVRATRRRGEIGVRRALGASGLRITQGLLIEGLLISAAAGALGLVIGFLGIRALLSIDTAGLPRLGEGSLLGIDWRIIAFTVAVSMLTAVLFSLAPAVMANRSNLAAVINDAGGRASSGRRNVALSTLVVVEVAAAAILMVGAALLVRTSVALGQVDAGFEPSGLITMQTSLTGTRFETTASVAEVVRLARERVRSLPGAVEVAATCCIPAQTGLGLPFNILGRDDPGLFTGSNAVVFTSPGYFEAFGIPVLRGRGFDEGDAGGAPPVAIINEALARQYWQNGADPLRDRMLIGGGADNLPELAEEPPRQIVGIVGNVRGDGLASDLGPIMYVPQAQMPDAMMELVASLLPTTWVVRTEGGAASSTQIAEELRLATGVPVTNVGTMNQVLLRSISRQRLHTALLGVFGGVAVLLAAVGIYAVMAYAIESRSREIGIRVALGATPRRIRRLVVGSAVRLVGAGLVIGLVGAYFLVALLRAVLYEVQPHDPLVFVGVPAALVVVCLFSAAIPAVRAGRIVRPAPDS